MSLPTVNRQWIFAERPTASISLEHFARRDAEVPAPGPGEILVRTKLLSLDAGMRAWMSPIPTYRSPLTPGQVMEGFALGEVIESRAPGLGIGDLVEGPTGWQDYAVLRPSSVVKRDRKRPPELLMSVLGSGGLTAYFGLLEIGRPKPGETVLVSAAAGSVGSIAAQIARIAGCRVVGVAGSDAKCAWLMEELKLDAAINYKNGDLGEAMKAVCPDGIDVYFDNTGGAILEAALSQMNIGGRIACCGIISQYDEEPSQGGTRGVPFLLVTRRLKMEGFLVADFFGQRRQAEIALARWVEAGKIKSFQDVVEGFEQVPAAFLRIFSGEHRGKLMARVS